VPLLKNSTMVAHILIMRSLLACRKRTQAYCVYASRRCTSVDVVAVRVFVKKESSKPRERRKAGHQNHGSELGLSAQHVSSDGSPFRLGASYLRPKCKPAHFAEPDHACRLQQSNSVVEAHNASYTCTSDHQQQAPEMYAVLDLQETSPKDCRSDELSLQRNMQPRDGHQGH
jgi:hypothetical protein